MPSQKSIDYGSLIITLLLYGFIGFEVDRHETLSLLTSYFAVFAIYLYTIHKANNDNIIFWLYASISFRVVLLFAVPHLSDDFYRFIWDGRLFAAGYHPFAEVPAFYMEHGLAIPGLDESLFRKLNSPSYYTIYPPIAQYVFWAAVRLFPDSLYGSMVAMKTVLFVAELGTLWGMRKLLIQFNLPSKRILFYALNPLVIIELVGNLHFEAILILCLVLAFLLLNSQKFFYGGLLMASAICTKLIPLIFLPAFFPRLGRKNVLLLYVTIGLTCLILFLPLWDKEILSGFENSLSYYFQKFEFNASIYYVVREWGFWQYGYNIIQTAGSTLAIVSFILIMFISLTRARLPVATLSLDSPTIVDKHLMLRFMLILLTYFLFTTTLHPWYITTLLAISIFTEFRFALLWTALVFITYFGYSLEAYQEHLGFTLIEYLIVLGYFAFEWLREKKQLIV